MNPLRLLAEFLYRVRKVPSLFGRFRFWFYLAVFVLLLAVLSPFVSVLGNLLGAIGRILGPLVGNPAGRAALGIAALLAAGLFLYRRFRVRGRLLLGAYAVDRFLAGMLDLSSGGYRRAARNFSRVIRTGRFTDLSKSVDVYPDIVADARIKLALCYRELGDVERAMEQLELLKPKDLPPAVRRDHSEAKAFVYALSRELMDETIDREIDRALEADPANRRLLALKRERAERVGDFESAAAAQRAILRAAPVAAADEERRRLAVLLARNALRLRRAGRDEDALAEVERARELDPALSIPALVVGDIAAERGDARGAIREWARAPSLAGMDRIRALLAADRLEGAGDLAFLATEFPHAGVLRLLAEHWIRKGRLRRARNCLLKLEELGLADRHSDLLTAEVMRRSGDGRGADRRLLGVLQGFLGAPPVPRENV